MSGDGFKPAVPAEVMKTMAETHRILFKDKTFLGLPRSCGSDFQYGFASPGGYLLELHDSMPRDIRDALEETVAACARDKDRGLLPDWLRDGLPELALDHYIRCGTLSEDSAYLLRTPGVLIMVNTDEDRGEGIHRLVWGTGSGMPVELTETWVVFTPDGMLYKPYILKLFCSFAFCALAEDAYQSWFIPGADALELRKRSDRMASLEDRAKQAGKEQYRRMVIVFMATYGVPERQPDGGHQQRLANAAAGDGCALPRRGVRGAAPPSCRTGEDGPAGEESPAEPARRPFTEVSCM